MATGVKTGPLCLTMGFYVEVPLATDASDGLSSAALIKVQTSPISLRRFGCGPEVSFKSRNEAMIAVYTPPPLKRTGRNNAACPGPVPVLCAGVYNWLYLSNHRVVGNNLWHTSST